MFWMEPDSDSELLQRFSREGNEIAFTRLVERYAPMIRGAALRCAEDVEMAEEVTQNVFAILARKASSVPSEHLAGWLYNTAYLEARNARRKGVRYRRALHKLSDHTLTMMDTTDRSPTDTPLWESIRPHLDEALLRLPEKFRKPIMLRFFEKRSVREIAAATGKTEHASRKELERSLQRLGVALQKKGVFASGAALSVMLAGQNLFAPPASAAALASAALKIAPTLSAASLLTPTFYIMTTTQTAKIAAVVVLAAIPATIFWRQKSALEEEVRSLRAASQISQVDAAKHSRKDHLPLESVPHIVKKDQSEKPPGNVPKAAPRIGGWKNALITDLKDSEWKIRRGAAATLKGSTVPAASAVPSLTSALGDEEWQVRKAVAEALGYYGAEAAEAVPALVKALADPEWQVRMPAAEALAAIGEGARASAPELAAALRDEEWQVRNAAAMALATIPPLNADAVPMLASVLNDEEWQVITNASMALGAIGPSAAATVPALTSALKHEEANVRLAAANALGLIGQPDPEAVLGLKGLAADDDMRVRQQAASVLSKLGTGGSP